MPTVHIIVAAGSGSRHGNDADGLPKQFQCLAGKPVVVHSVERLHQADPEGQIVVVVSPDMRAHWQQVARDNGIDYALTVEGGDTRWHSVSNAITAAVTLDTDIVTVHDAARPLVDPEVVKCMLVAVIDGNDGAVPVVEVCDSLRHVDADGKHHAVVRAEYRAVQTPQAFRADKLRDAYLRGWSSDFTDDASVMEAAGHTQLKLVAGSPMTFKITHPGDIARAEALLGQ